VDFNAVASRMGTGDAELAGTDGPSVTPALPVRCGRGDDQEQLDHRDHPEHTPTPVRVRLHRGRKVSTAAESPRWSRGVSGRRCFRHSEALRELTAALAHHAGRRIIGGTASGVVIEHLVAAIQQLLEVVSIFGSHGPRTVEERIWMRSAA